MIVKDSKFAYLICDPSSDDNPLIDDRSIQEEVHCSQLINVVLSKVDTKNNPTNLAPKHIKFIKDNYFYLTSKLNLYDFNKFVRDHFVFVYAFSPDASYKDLQKFNSNIMKKYGNTLFIPFTLNEKRASRLVSFSHFEQFIANLYSIVQINEKLKSNGEKFLSLLSEPNHDLLLTILNGKSLNSKDLESLTSYANDERKSILTNGWL